MAKMKIFLDIAFALAILAIGLFPIALGIVIIAVMNSFWKEAADDHDCAPSVRFCQICADREDIYRDSDPEYDDAAIRQQFW